MRKNAQIPAEKNRENKKVVIFETNGGGI